MFDAQKQKYGVVGNPICHSRSPQIHHFFAQYFGICIDYRRIYTEKMNFQRQIQCFFNDGGLGLNVTLPFKGEAALCATELSDRARLVGVVNTLKRTEDGIYGDTTDGQGFIEDIMWRSVNNVFEGTVLILGAGGAVRGLLPDILQHNPKCIIILNRTSSRALGLIEEVESWREQLGFVTVLFGGGYDYDLSSVSPTLLVQGSSGDFQFSWDCDLSSTFCYDLNYGERAEQFVRWARAHGALHVYDGLGMLVGQAAASFALWTGLTPDIGVTMTYLKNVNPWLEDWWQPPFEQVDIQQLCDAIIQRVREKEQLLEARLNDFASGVLVLSWDALVRCYEFADDQLQRLWCVLKHLYAVDAHVDVRTSYHQISFEISEHYMRERQNKLFCAYVTQLMQSAEFSALAAPQQKWCAVMLRKFRLAGVELEVEVQDRLVKLESQIQDLSHQLSDTVLDARDAWSLDISDSELAGVPLDVIELARESYLKVNPENYNHQCRLSLQEPMVHFILRYCENRQLRQIVYEAYVTTASDVGPDAGLYDTSDIIRQLLDLRHQKAELLGFEDFVSYSMETKLAQSAQQVIQVLDDIVASTYPQAASEFMRLQLFAKSDLGLDQVYAWDFAFVSEKEREKLYAVDSAQVRDFLPVKQVLQGVFAFIEQFFKVSCRIDYGVPTYHESVLFVIVSNSDGVVIGGLFLDLYSREHKQSGAWVDICRQRYVTLEGVVSNPIAYVVCNFMPESAGQSALLAHDDVVCLFQQIGQGLHHVLTQIDVADVSGFREIEEDLVFVSSRLMGHWAWRDEVLPALTAHYRFGQQMSKVDLSHVIAAKNFQSGIRMLAQIEYSLFDLYLHCQLEHCQLEYTGFSWCDFERIWHNVRSKVSLMQMPDCHRFPNGFRQIFAGGYAADYYGYIWAEAYAADMFSEFKRAGVLNLTLAKNLLDRWFAVGGVQSAQENFREFMGRGVDFNVLLDELEIERV